MTNHAYEEVSIVEEVGWTRAFVAVLQRRDFKCHCERTPAKALYTQTGYTQLCYWYRDGKYTGKYTEREVKFEDELGRVVWYRRNGTDTEHKM